MDRVKGASRVNSLQPTAQDESLQANMVFAPEPVRLGEGRWRQAPYIVLSQNQRKQDVLSMSSLENSMTFGVPMNVKSANWPTFGLLAWGVIQEGCRALSSTDARSWKVEV